MAPLESLQDTDEVYLYPLESLGIRYDRIASTQTSSIHHVDLLWTDDAKCATVS